MLMNELTIQIDSLRRRPCELEWDLEPGLLELDDEIYRFVQPVRGRLTFQMIGTHDVLGEGTLNTRIEGACVRCLDPAHADLRVRIREVWLKDAPADEKPGEDSDDIQLFRTHDGNEIDLIEPLRELIMAELPDRVLCAEDCKGLCSGCGANLNREACRCAPGREAGDADETVPDWKRKLKNLHME
jgi:uncharacterized protein